MAVLEGYTHFLPENRGLLSAVADGVRVRYGKIVPAAPPLS